jgi:DNA-binding PadR family transcriptional regulator
MGARLARVRDKMPMRSLVNWALLGLVIDRPSYAYELAQRFERTYEDALTLSSVSHVYMALSTLKDRELIEEIPGTRSGRQPKPHYRPTEKGLTAYREWLVEQICEDRQRQRLFVLQLGALTRNPEIALEIVDRFEQTCLDEASRTPLPQVEDPTTDGAAQLLGRLVNEESRLSLGAKLSWVEYARQQFKALASSRGTRR